MTHSPKFTLQCLPNFLNSILLVTTGDDNSAIPTVRMMLWREAKKQYFHNLNLLGFLSALCR